MGDLNIDEKRLQNAADVCRISQLIDKPTRISVKSDGTQVSTCIDHMFTNAAELCSESIPMSIGCSDHDLGAIVRRTKKPKLGPKVIMKRLYKMFDWVKFNEDVKEVCRSFRIRSR